MCNSFKYITLFYRNFWFKYVFGSREIDLWTLLMLIHTYISILKMIYKDGVIEKTFYLFRLFQNVTQVYSWHLKKKKSYFISCLSLFLPLPIYIYVCIQSFNIVVLPALPRYAFYTGFFLLFSSFKILWCMTGASEGISRHSFYNIKLTLMLLKVIDE